MKDITSANTDEESKLWKEVHLANNEHIVGAAVEWIGKYITFIILFLFYCRRIADQRPVPGLPELRLPATQTSSQPQQ
jgi:hypothetical protein